MIPFAPGRFSITIDWPSASDTFCASGRPIRSFGPPAPNGMMSLMFCEGQDCAFAFVTGKPQNTKPRAMMANRIRVDRVIVGPPASSVADAFVSGRGAAQAKRGDALHRGGTAANQHQTPATFAFNFSAAQSVM